MTAAIGAPQVNSVYNTGDKLRYVFFTAGRRVLVFSRRRRDIKA